MEQPSYSTEDIVNARIDAIEVPEVDPAEQETAPTPAPEASTEEPSSEEPSLTSKLDDTIASNQELLDRLNSEIHTKEGENDVGAELLADLDKPAEEYGVKENLMEASMAAVQGILSGAQSFATVGERYIDAARGEDVGGPGYVPDWAPLKNISHPVLKSKWGPVVENVFHYGTIGYGVSLIPGIGPASIIRGAGAAAAISDKSQRTGSDPMSGFRQLIPMIDEIPVFGKAAEAISTSDLDHPLFKTLKNVLQDMGMAAPLKFALDAYFAKATPEVKRLTAMADDDIEYQVLDMAEVQQAAAQTNFEGDSFGAYKNKPYADIYQGNAFSRGTPEQVLDQLNRIDEEGIAGGSTDPIFTRAQVRRMADNNGMSGDEMREIAKSLLSSDKYAELLEDAADFKKTPAEVFRPSYERYLQIIGHDAMKLGPEEYFKSILEDAPMQTGAGPASKNVTAISTENVVVTDLVVSHLLKQANVHAKAAREVMEWGDIWAVDGPLKNLRDNIVFGIGQARRSRKLASYQLSKFKNKDKDIISGRDIVDEETFMKSLDEDFAETRANIDFFFEVVEEMDDPALNATIVDIFASAENTRNWMDLEAYMRKKVQGGEFRVGTKGELRRKSGMLSRELQGVFMNSALHSPASFQRAALGTAEFGFFNTTRRMVGHKMMKLLDPSYEGHVFGDIQATAEWVAWFESIPDGWKLFKRRLKSNFTKNSDYNSRYGKYQTETDWDFAERFYKTHGKSADRIAYNASKWARWFNSSTKIPALVSSYTNRMMGPIDEGWTLVAAKSRSRGMAIRQALEEQAAGRISEITPEVLKRADELYFGRLLDGDGNIDIFKDPVLTEIVQYNTLTTPLQGIPGGIDALAKSNPIAARLLAFATPGFNKVGANIENLPLIGAATRKQNRILRATPETLQTDKLAQYGIRTVEDLEAAKAKVIGGQAIGAALAALHIYRRLSGYEPNQGLANIDRGQREAMRSAGAKEGARIFGLRVPYSLFETHDLMFKSIDLVIDNAHKMGPEWVDDWHFKLITAIASVYSDDSTLSQLNELADLAAQEPGTGVGKIVGNLLNTQLPYGGGRNDVGQILNPQLKELNGDLVSSILNRNKYFAQTTDEMGNVLEMPDKYNILNGETLNDAHPLVQIACATTPFCIDFSKDSKALDLLAESNYNMRTLTYAAPGPDSLNLADHPEIRSAFQREIGLWRDDKGRSLETILELYAERDDVIHSIEKMKSEVGYPTKFMALLPGEAGNKARLKLIRDPMSFYHNRLIHTLFKRARSEAWANLRDRDDVQQLLEREKSIRAAEDAMGRNPFLKKRLEDNR
tara:strand:+ start:3227 stop:7183 length:3957 start_codon:yes stop_codon:yes gene_type:complete